MKRISVVIVNYNTRDLLSHCLERLQASQLDRQLRIFVVDNGSHDGSVDLIHQHYPDVELIVSSRNLGYAAANNLALARIHEDWVLRGKPADDSALLLNTDCFVEPDSLQITADFLDQHPDCGIVGPKLVLRDGSLDLACRRSFPRPINALWKLTGLARLFPDSPRFASYNLTYLDPDQTHEVDSVVGAYMKVRLSAIDQAGLMDDSFFMYGEDLDWAYRIKRQGWSVYYHPATTVLHYKGATSSRQSYRLIIEFYRAMYLFHRKHYAGEMPAAINCAITAGIIARGTFALIRNLFRPSRAKKVN
ncbi:MAG: glycosyltransferase family 2 protein [Sphaerobacteraceae bacterium]|nr:MAG: glycosyltransferase family 2 protein [Sphaerobacteraceae bacterium]